MGLLLHALSFVHVNPSVSLVAVALILFVGAVLTFYR